MQHRRRLCQGSGALVGFTVKALHPSFVSVKPNPFSPNGDGYKDTHTYTVSLPDQEHLKITIKNGAGSAVWGPHSFGTLGAGQHTFTWTGRNNAGNRVPSGTYTIVADTTATVSGATLVGRAQHTVRVDLIAPPMSGITGSGSTFYPVRDGYKDAFHPHLMLGENARLTLAVTTTTGARVRTIAASLSAGYVSLPWNGRYASGALVPAGGYRYRFTARDAAGNTRRTSPYTVYVSHKKLVAKTATIVKTATSAAYYDSSDYNCADYDAGLSYYNNGVWLENYCDPYWDGAQLVAGLFRFTLPRLSSTARCGCPPTETPSPSRSACSPRSTTTPPATRT